MPDAGKDAEQKKGWRFEPQWPKEGVRVFRPDGHELITWPAVEAYLNALQQQLADVTAERDARAFDADTLDDLYHKALDALADVRQERDRYREALLEIRAMASVAGYDAGHEGIYSRARAALTPGAKGETDGE